MFRTLEDFPTEYDGEPIKWAAQSFGKVRNEVEKLYEKLSRLDAGEGDRSVSIWYVAPGAPPDQAIGVEAETEFLKNAWTVGTYFLRFKFTEKGDPIYVQCSPQPEQKPSALAGQAADERRILLQSAQLSEQDNRISQYQKRMDELYRERNDLTDKLADRDRTIASLEAQLAAALEDAAPMFDDQGVEKILDLVKLWTEGGEEGRSQALILSVLARVSAFATSLYEVPEILGAIVSARPDHYTAFAEAVNEATTEIARAMKQPKTKLLHTSDQLVPLLAQHGIQVGDPESEAPKKKSAAKPKRKVRA